MKLKYWKTNIIERNNIAFVVHLVLGTIITYILLNLWNVHEVFWDTEVYWSISRYWDENGLLSFKQYPIQYLYRGYFFPWFLSVIKIGSKENVKSIWIVLSIMVSFFSMYLMPFLIKYVSKVKKLSWAWKYVFLILFLLFYKGLICYPLSDFYACFFGMFSFFFGIHSFECTKKEQKLKAFLCILVSGYSGMCTYFIRTNYLFFILLGITIWFYCIIKSNIKWQTIIVYVVGLFMGIAMVSLPQLLINYYATDQITPFVMTEGYANVSLFDFQLYYGLLYQKYETYIGTDYQSPAMCFLDSVGIKIIGLEGMQNAEQLGGILGYIKLIFKYPFDFLGIYLRHLVSMIDIRYPEVYITSLVYDAKMIFLNYTCIFVGVYSGYVILKRSFETRLCEGIRNTILLIFMCLPSLILIPGAIETRFGISIWCVIYGLLCFSNVFSYIKSIDMKASCIL